MYPAIMGKHIIINELYAVREYNIQSIGKCLDNMSVIKSDLKYKDEYNCYINLLSNKLLTIDNCSYQIAEKIITDSVDRYMMSNFTFSNRQLVKKILKKYTNLLKIIYKLFVKDAQHKNKLTGIMKCLIFIMNLFIVRIFTFWIRLLIMPSVKDIHHKNKLKLNMFPEFIPAYEKWTIVRNFILKYYNQCY